ncbi:MAG: DUF1464 domain-containing protein [Thermoprotei archaeon]|nr:MAG: DUF1464 domain-containing protein [Thermoprotei archaeon]
MARALGIDPGTRSFDLVVVEEGRVVWERSVDTVRVAEEPSSLVETVEEAGDVDLIAGPSGYGAPLIYNQEIADPEVFAREILLLTRREDLEEGVRRGEVGIAVYKAIVDVVKELHARRLPVVYIPSVVLLPTVPSSRKFNKLDMGTADKMAIAALAVHEQCERLGLELSDARLIVVEMGFGYNAAVAVNSGRIVDGLGGTLTHMGFLTIGAVDAEVAVAGRSWTRSDVFYGGAATICESLDLDFVVEEGLRGVEPYASVLEALVDSVSKAARALTSTVKEPREVVLSGRLAKNEGLLKLVSSELSDVAPVVKLRGLPGSKLAKEAAQGYALIAEGLSGGFFKPLVDHLRIAEARGTVMSWLHHPRLAEAKERLLRVYRASIKEEAIKRVL